MYEKIEGGEIIEIQGLKCNLPPVGYVFNGITKQLEYIGVYSRSNDVLKQYWERIPYPSWYNDVVKKETEYLKKKKEDEPDFYDERYEAYKQQEWKRRLWGFWIMVKGKPIYLTGFYYMLLQWFSIDIGYATFNIPHLKKTYFLEYCIQDPLCMGLIDITKRRFLKTFMGGLFILEYITRTKEVNGAIQSKTGSDAKKVFSKAVVNPFRKFPRFFRPEYDTSLGINPKTELRFQQTNVRGKKAEDSMGKDELNSMVDWGSADGIAYDGSKLHRYFSDEWAKTTETNIFDRHEVIRYCLLNEKGEIIGKALYSSTVEKLTSEKDGVQEAARLLWDESDQLDRQENGMTKSGLYRFFQTADEGRNFDIYGYPDVDKTIKDILSDRKSVANNPRALSARMRKEPRTVEEAFSIDGDDCVFNSLNITAREKQLKEVPVIKRNVIFYRDLDQSVRWREVLENETDFHWEISQFPEKDLCNNSKNIEGLKTPLNTDKYAIAVDSYSNSQSSRKYGSKAAAWLGIKYDILNSESTGKAIGLLYGRPLVKEKLHEQVMLCAEYFGCKVWYEFTADDYLSYFRERGRIKYLGLFPISTIDPIKRATEVRLRGFPITPFSLTKQLDTGIAYFENYCYKIDFLQLFKYAKTFDPYNRTAFDMVVAFLMLLVVLYEQEPPINKKEPILKTYE